MRRMEGGAEKPPARAPPQAGVEIGAPRRSDMNAVRLRENVPNFRSCDAERLKGLPQFPLLQEVLLRLLGKSPKLSTNMLDVRQAPLHDVIRAGVQEGAPV